MRRDDGWQWKYFGGSPRQRQLAKLGLLEAPTPSSPSCAMREAQAAREARDRRDREADRRLAEAAARAREQFATEQRARDIAARWRSMAPERRQEMREDVARFGRETVVGLWRRITGNATFDLPERLEDPDERD